MMAVGKTVKAEAEIPGSVWLQKEGTVLHTIPVYGGAFEVQLHCVEVGAKERNGKWEPFFTTRFVVARVQEEGDRATLLLDLWPQAQVQVMSLSMTPMCKKGSSMEATGEVDMGEEAQWVGGRGSDVIQLPRSDAAGGISEGTDSKAKLDNALHYLGGPPPHTMATRAEAVEALKAALKELTFLFRAELELSA